MGYDPPSLPPKDVGPTKIQVLVQLKGLTGVEPQKTFQVQIGIWNGKSTPLYQPALFKKSLNGAVVFADIDKKDIFSENMFLILRISQLDKGILDFINAFRNSQASGKRIFGIISNAANVFKR